MGGLGYPGGIVAVAVAVNRWADHVNVNRCAVKVNRCAVKVNGAVLLCIGCAGQTIGIAS
jgi:hypothetical protein